MGNILGNLNLPASHGTLNNLGLLLAICQVGDLGGSLAATLANPLDVGDDLLVLVLLALGAINLQF